MNKDSIGLYKSPDHPLEKSEITDGTKVLWNKEAEINNPYQPLKEDDGTIVINFEDKPYAWSGKGIDFLTGKTLILSDQNNG